MDGRLEKVNYNHITFILSFEILLRVYLPRTSHCQKITYAALRIDCTRSSHAIRDIYLHHPHRLILVQMPKTTPPPPLSRRGGTLILRGITLFLASSRGARLRNGQTNRRSGVEMINKEISKSVPKVLEIAKKNTNFSR